MSTGCSYYLERLCLPGPTFHKFVNGPSEFCGLVITSCDMMTLDDPAINQEGDLLLLVDKGTLFIASSGKWILVDPGIPCYHFWTLVNDDIECYNVYQVLDSGSFKITQVVGDIYIDTNTSILWKLGDNGEFKVFWTLGCCLDSGLTGDKGPTGDPGKNGKNGTDGTGVNGMTGEKGPTGNPGSNGDNGMTGEKGPTGSPGSNGVNGMIGEKGPTGNPGANGVNGPNGETGPTGNPGIDGITGEKGPTGNPGSNGVNGITGEKGPTGDPGVSWPSLSEYFVMSENSTKYHISGPDVVSNVVSSISWNSAFEVNITIDNSFSHVSSFGIQESIPHIINETGSGSGLTFAPSNIHGNYSFRLVIKHPRHFFIFLLKVFIDLILFINKYLSLNTFDFY